MKVNVIRLKEKLSRYDIIKLQISIYCFLNNIVLSENELNCLTLLACNKNMKLSDFCNYVVDSEIFKTSQTVRNFLSRAQEHNMVIKSEGSKKTVALSEKLIIQYEGSILLDYKFIHDSGKK